MSGTRGHVLLAVLAGCAPAPVRPPAAAPSPAAPAPVASPCEERLATIPYLLRRVKGSAWTEPKLAVARLVLDDAGEAAVARFAERMATEPGLHVEVGMHMDPDTRGSVAPEVVSERLTELGRELALALRAQVRPDRVGLVVYGAPGEPPDGSEKGSWIELVRRCGPVAPDRDHDAVVDARDRCADEPEDHDGWQDEDGCVDRDNDEDGVLDAHTWDGERWTNCDGTREREAFRDCRNLPEDFDGIEDQDGCPDVWMSDCAYFKGRIDYDPRSPKISPEAVDAALAELFTQVDRFELDREGVRFEVDGHSGKQRDKQRAYRLSERMANAVRDELVRRGVAAERLQVRPFGAEMPLADERTPAGRRANHRVDVTWEYCGTGARRLCR